MIGIIVALNSEAQNVVDKIENKTTLSLCGKTVYEGKLFGNDCVLIISGIGKVNASLCTQKIIDTYSPDFVLNFGTAGGVDSSVLALNYYQISKCTQFDFDLRDLDGVPLGYIQDYNTSEFIADTLNISTGLEKRKLATADRFTESSVDTQSILDCKCSLRDMEGGAIAQVCTANNMPLIMIKGVTDVVGSGLTSEQFYKNLITVNAKFFQVIERFLSK